LPSNATESLSNTGGGSSGQWSLPVGMNSPWSSAAPSFSSFTSADQHFTSSQTQFQSYDFQSLPNAVVPDSYRVQPGQVEPSGLSLGSQVIGYNADNFLLHDNHTFGATADDTACYREMQAVQWNQVPASSGAVAPIPEFVTNASYDDGTFLMNFV